MKIDMSREMVNLLNGEIYKEEEKNVTLGLVCARSLITMIPDIDSQATPETVYQNRALGASLLKGGEHELETKVISELHRRIVKTWVPDVAGQAYAILEGKE